MQSKDLIARPHPFLQPAASIESLDLFWPSVTSLNTRHKRLADAEFGCDLALQAARLDSGQNRSIASVKIGHAFTLASDNIQRSIGLVRLDRNHRSHQCQEPLNIWGRRHGKAIQPLVIRVRGTSIFFDASVSEPVMNRVERGSMRVRQPQSNSALIRVDLNTALAIQEAGQVSGEGVVGPTLHSGILISMAVPCMAWIGRRIQMVAEITPEAKSA